jgi:hypothetical protein
MKEDGQMTSQTKKFIEISDVMAIRIECGSCGAMLSTPIPSFQTAPQRCSNCSTPFVGHDSPHSLSESFSDTISAFKKMQRIATHHKFKIAFEIEMPETMRSISQASGLEP